MKLKKLPIFERPREKLLEKGPDNLTDVELVAIILGSGTSKEDILHISHRVIKLFPFSTSTMPTSKELQKINGIGQVKACVLLAVYALSLRWSKSHTSRSVKNPETVLAYCTEIRNKHQEHVLILYLDARYNLVTKEIVAVGGLNYLQLEPREVFAPAFKNPCAAVIIAHNHPSNSVEPSEDDLNFTKKMIAASKLLGITILDHLIVSKDHFYSFRENDLL